MTLCASLRIQDRAPTEFCVPVWQCCSNPGNQVCGRISASCRVKGVNVKGDKILYPDIPTMDIANPLALRECLKSIHVESCAAKSQCAPGQQMQNQSSPVIETLAPSLRCTWCVPRLLPRPFIYPLYTPNGDYIPLCERYREGPVKDHCQTAA